MIIDKARQFYTAEDVQRLQELRERQDVLVEKLRDYFPLWENIKMALKAGDEVPIKAELFELLTESEALQEEANNILRAIEQRYTDSFAADPSAILDDVREVVGAIEKSEYIDYQKRIKDLMQSLYEPQPDETEEEKKARKRALEYSRQNFSNCRGFILKQLRLQLNAIDFYGDKGIEEQAFAIAEEKAETFYKRPKGAKPARVPKKNDFLPPVAHGGQPHGELLSIATSPYTVVIDNVLQTEDLMRWRDDMKRISHGRAVTIQENGDMRQVIYSNNRDTFGLQFLDINKISRQNPNAAKLFVRILMHAGEQNVHKGFLQKEIVSFPLSELVTSGQYKTVESARHGFDKAADILTDIKVTAKVKKGKRLQASAYINLFSTIRVEKSTCTVRLNPDIMWGEVMEFYTSLPDYYFELSGKAANLLHYIFYIARQRTAEIKENGYFTISFEAIHSRLGLPELDSAAVKKNPQRAIKDQIEDAIEEIEETYCKYAPPIPKDATGAAAEPDFALLPVVEPAAPIKEYLQGYLKISLKGDYARPFLAMSDRTKRRVESAKRKQERIQEKAAALKAASEN